MIHISERVTDTLTISIFAHVRMSWSVKKEILLVCSDNAEIAYLKPHTDGESDVFIVNNVALLWMCE